MIDAVTQGTDLGQARPPNAPGLTAPRIFEVEFMGQLQRLDVTVSSNGFIVQANPS